MIEAKYKIGDSVYLIGQTSKHIKSDKCPTCGTVKHEYLDKWAPGNKELTVEGVLFGFLGNWKTGNGYKGISYSFHNYFYFNSADNEDLIWERETEVFATEEEAIKECAKRNEENE